MACNHFCPEQNEDKKALKVVSEEVKDNGEDVGEDRHESAEILLIPAEAVDKM